MYDVQFSTDALPVDIPGAGLVPSSSAVSADAAAAGPALSLLSHAPHGWQPMTLPNGSAYLCRIPSAADLAAAPTPAPAALKPGQKLPDAARTALSTAMAGACVQKLSGWFTYDVCWEQSVRQYHMEGTVLKDEYYLGKGPTFKLEKGATADVTFRVHHTHGPYVAATFLNGTLCDLTGKDRVSEVRLFCLPDGADERIELELAEPETCRYVITMAHPAACIPELQRVQGTQVPIVCYRV